MITVLLSVLLILSFGQATIIANDLPGLISLEGSSTYAESLAAELDFINSNPSYSLSHPWTALEHGTTMSNVYLEYTSVAELRLIGSIAPFVPVNAIFPELQQCRHCVFGGAPDALTVTCGDWPTSNLVDLLDVRTFTSPGDNTVCEILVFENSVHCTGNRREHLSALIEAASLPVADVQCALDALRAEALLYYQQISVRTQIRESYKDKIQAIDKVNPAIVNHRLFVDRFFDYATQQLLDAAHEIGVDVAVLENLRIVPIDVNNLDAANAFLALHNALSASTGRLADIYALWIQALRLTVGGVTLTANKSLVMTNVSQFVSGTYTYEMNEGFYNFEMPKFTQITDGVSLAAKVKASMPRFLKSTITNSLGLKEHNSEITYAARHYQRIPTIVVDTSTYLCPRGLRPENVDGTVYCTCVLGQPGVLYSHSVEAGTCLIPAPTHVPYTEGPYATFSPSLFYPFTLPDATAQAINGVFAPPAFTCSSGVVSSSTATGAWECRNLVPLTRAPAAVQSTVSQENMFNPQLILPIAVFEPFVILLFSQNEDFEPVVDNDAVKMYHLLKQATQASDCRFTDQPDCPTRLTTTDTSITLPRSFFARRGSYLAIPVSRLSDPAPSAFTHASSGRFTPALQHLFPAAGAEFVVQSSRDNTVYVTTTGVTDPMTVAVCGTRDLLDAGKLLTEGNIDQFGWQNAMNAWNGVEFNADLTAQSRSSFDRKTDYVCAICTVNNYCTEGTISGVESIVDPVYTPQQHPLWADGSVSVSDLVGIDITKQSIYSTDWLLPDNHLAASFEVTTTSFTTCKETAEKFWKSPNQPLYHAHALRARVPTLSPESVHVITSADYTDPLNVTFTYACLTAPAPAPVLAAAGETTGSARFTVLATELPACLLRGMWPVSALAAEQVAGQAPSLVLASARHPYVPTDQLDAVESLLNTKWSSVACDTGVVDLTVLFKESGTLERLSSGITMSGAPPKWTDYALAVVCGVVSVVLGVSIVVTRSTVICAPLKRCRCSDPATGDRRMHRECCWQCGLKTAVTDFCSYMPFNDVIHRSRAPHLHEQSCAQCAYGLLRLEPRFYDLNGARDPTVISKIKANY